MEENVNKKRNSIWSYVILGISGGSLSTLLWAGLTKNIAYIVIGGVIMGAIASGILWLVRKSNF